MAPGDVFIYPVLQYDNSCEYDLLSDADKLFFRASVIHTTEESAEVPG